LPNHSALRVTFTSGEPVSASRTGARLTVEHHREDLRKRLRPEGVVFSLRSSATNDTSFPVGKFRRTRDAAIIAE
jgi:hypothetical protein